MGKRLIQQARGKGGPVYRAASFKYKSDAKLKPIAEKTIIGVIKDFVHCPGHTAPLVEIEYEDGTTAMHLAPEGVKVGDTMAVGPDAEAKAGNILELKDIPEGTPVNNIEIRPGDGGKLCRSSGVCARIMSKIDDKVTIVLPSKKTKIISGKCRAMVGVLAAGGRTEKPMLKAGKKHHQMRARNKRYPRISAAAQNAVDHPFGNTRGSRKAKQKAASKDAPPGRKVGTLWPKRTGRKQ